MLPNYVHVAAVVRAFLSLTTDHMFSFHGLGLIPVSDLRASFTSVFAMSLDFLLQNVVQTRLTPLPSIAHRCRNMQVSKNRDCLAYEELHERKFADFCIHPGGAILYKTLFSAPLSPMA